MSPPEGVLFGDFSAGIDIRGFAHGNIVGNNIYSRRRQSCGRRRCLQRGFPGNTKFVLNRFDDFDASVAGVIVGNGVSDTLIVGLKGTINDHGSNTVILPFRGRPRSKE
jgi:hypothetical protein